MTCGSLSFRGQRPASFLPIEKSSGNRKGFYKKVARPAGFEPATYGLEVRCSIQLSYERVTSGFLAA